MRIECDKCAAKYSIADEKVRGKTFKIRCKKCSNVIIVRDKAASPEADASAGEPASEEPAGWHLAIDGDTVGPLPEDEVRRRYDAGQIDKSTSVWQEGFEDWLELGQIEAFADLPDRAAHAGHAGAAAAVGGAAAVAAADDPFASSGSDDAFAASSGEFGGGGFGSQPESAPAAAEPAAESPRIDSLTGQRNENSVLFSLDSLKAMAATSKPSSAGPVRQAPSTTAPSSEGSGLIDIRAMGAMMDMGSSDGGLGGGGGGGGGGDDEMLPSFGGGGLGGLSVEPLASEAPVVAPIAAEPQRSNAPMYIIILLLASGMIGLGVMFFLKEDPQPQVIKEVVTVPGSVVEKDPKDSDDKDDEDSDDKDDKDDKDDEGETEGDTEGAVAGADGTKSGTKKKKKAGGSGGGSGSGGVAGDSGGSGGGSSGGGSGGATTKKEPDVDCLLDPDLPKCKGGGGGGGGGGSKPPVDSSLPAKLTGAEITPVIKGVKTAAKSCGSGTAVEVKFSIKGSTGSVVSAVPQKEHASTPVGKCVANALKNAKFPKFQAEQQGVTFTFRL